RRPRQRCIRDRAGTEHDTGLDILKLENIAAYFREVRKKYHAFEGQLKGYDSRILVAQVPGGICLLLPLSAPTRHSLLAYAGVCLK
ncbi:hypothetical protein, partial [Salmonella enterica]|uniref:hypothetical protein n=1 Tax=Salmonella enterica TaxID=28901 RepID=UPI001F471BA4